MRIIATLLAGTLLMAGAGAAWAATPPPAQAKPGAAAGKAQVQDAMLYLNVLISGLQSDKVEQPIKGVLVGCLYNNSLGTISESMDKVIAENPGKIHKDKPNELLGVMVRICGYDPKANAAPSGR